MVNRIPENKIKESYFKGKVIIITGARQTGKTTLSEKLLSDFSKDEVLKYNGDNPTDRDLLSNKDLNFLEKLIGSKRLVFIDEGQKIKTIGQTLKLLIDKYQKQKQIIVTGSSSFNLLDQTTETLTGRKINFQLFPLSLEEIFSKNNYTDILKNLEELLIYGSYPEVINQNTFNNKRKAVTEISTSYLYKDVLEFQGIKKSATIVKLLKAIALQIGSEVSYTELANTVGLNKATVESYIDILEKNYILFRLPPFTKNKRKVISKLRKIYFCDLGVRNAIINNFNLLSNRNDTGAMFENFLAIERLKYQSYHEIYAENYFWRTYDGSEVDWVEDINGQINGYEFKWNEKKKIRESIFWKDFSEQPLTLINKNNLDDFIL